MTGFVLTTVNSSGGWTTFDATGALISNNATLQDGVNAAQSSGYPYVCYGNPAFPITEPVTFGPAAFQSYTLRNVSLQDTVTIDGLYGCDIDWRGGNIEWTSGTTSALLSVAPKNKSPNENSPMVELCRFAFPSMVAAKLSGVSITDMVLFDPSHGAIVNNQFNFASIDGGDIAANGIVVNNPSGNPAVSAVAQNDVSFGLITGFTSHGIQEGSGTINPATQPLGTNVWRGAIATSGAPYVAYQTFGVMSQGFFSSISIDDGTLQYGVFFSSGSEGNYVLSPQMAGTTPKIDQGTNNRLVTPTGW